MAIWPFGRKNKKTKQADQAMAASRTVPPDRTRTEPVRDTSDRSIPTLGRKSSRRESLKQRRRSSTGKLTKSQSRTKINEKAEMIPAVPPIPQAHRPEELNEKGGFNRSNQQPPNPPQGRGDIPSYYFQNPMSATSLGPEKFSVVREPPTLQGKRSANDQGIMRRKSSKRKADDHAREQEIKAMSSPIPIPKRPSSHNPGIMARDSKRIPGGLNRNLDRPMSDVSLPMQDSLRSTTSLASDQHAFKVSAFDVLSPRPTIRYSENPRSPSGSFGPSRTSTRKDKQPMIPEENTKASRRRIDDLADDMDAGTIKELMERDRRRLEKKRLSEREKAEKKLQRRSEKQREQESRNEQEAGEVDKQRVKEEEDVGLGIGGASTAPRLVDTLQEPTREQAVKTPESWLKDASREHLPLEDPFHDPVVGTSTSHLEAPTPIDEPDEPFLGTAKEVRLSQASMSPPASPIRHVQEPSNLSQFAELAPSTPEVPEIVDPDQRRDSDTSARFSTSWRPVKRTSQPQPRESTGSLQQRLQDLGQSDDDDVPGTPEAEKYMGSLTPAREEPPKIPERKRPYMGAATGIGGDSDDESSFQPAPLAVAQEEGKFHATIGKHPTIVREGPGRRVKSREGLLNDFQTADMESAESSPSGDSPVSPENATYPTIQRATSVDIGKGHARHISAGSARLLNLPPRSSGELKRFSAASGASGERSPLMPSPRLQETHDDDVD
ncbi:hypothetical protein P7C71_g1911, partial [Lecanoromycetidae sp. Uapishka_2]